MGNCCKRKAADGAFPQSDLRTSLMRSSFVEKLPSSTQVLVLSLSGVKFLPKADSYYETANCYVEMKLILKNESLDDGGVQTQTSEIKPSDLNPQWCPAKKFQFFLTMSKPKVLVSLYHFNSADPENAVPLGDTVLNIAALKLTETPKALKFNKIVSPTTGKSLEGFGNKIEKGATAVTVSASIHPLSSENLTHSQSLYEFQRWAGDWGSDERHMSFEQDARFCTSDGKIWKGTFEEITQQDLLAVQDGWYVTEDWHTLGTEQDLAGFEYSVDLTHPFWYPSQSSALYVVRRRIWRRELKRIAQAEKERNIDKAKRFLRNGMIAPFLFKRQNGSRANLNSETASPLSSPAPSAKTPVSGAESVLSTSSPRQTQSAYGTGERKTSETGRRERRFN